MLLQSFTKNRELKLALKLFKLFGWGIDNLSVLLLVSLKAMFNDHQKKHLKIVFGLAIS